MKGNSDLLVNSADNSYILEDNLQSNKVFEKLLCNLSPYVKPYKKLKDYNFLNQFWKSLISEPEDFPQTPNTSISNMVDEDIKNLSLDAVRSALSTYLDLPKNSGKLSKAIENSIQIYHEDYPYDFILEYNGERLGLMLLDKCYDTAGELKPVYRFNSQVKDFRGLY